jgi:hypothetical protein
LDKFLHRVVLESNVAVRDVPEVGIMTNRTIVLSLCGAVLVGLGGCKHKCCRQNGASSPMPAPFLPPGPGSTIPPANVPLNPGAGSLPPPDIRPNTSNRPAPEILLPDPIAPGGGTSSKKSDGLLGGPIGSVAPPATLEPKVAAKKPDSPETTQAGLPAFTQIAEGFAAGRKPTLEGFDTLKKNGYKTVIFTHAPGADVAAVRDVVEARGLTLVAIETTPEKLADTFEQVKKTTADKAARQVYLFDDDGTRAAAVLYLHFKTVELESADVSKIRAKSLGLVDDSEFWTAIKKILDS